jgi:hypothetical protein
VSQQDSLNPVHEETQACFGSGTNEPGLKWVLMSKDHGWRVTCSTTNIFRWRRKYLRSRSGKRNISGRRPRPVRLLPSPVLSHFFVAGVVWACGHPSPILSRTGASYIRGEEKSATPHSRSSLAVASPIITTARPDPPFLRGEKPCAFHPMTIPFASCSPVSSSLRSASVFSFACYTTSLTPTHTHRAASRSTSLRGWHARDWFRPPATSSGFIPFLILDLVYFFGSCCSICFVPHFPS